MFFSFPLASTTPFFSCACVFAGCSAPSPTPALPFRLPLSPFHPPPLPSHRVCPSQSALRVTPLPFPSHLCLSLCSFCHFPPLFSHLAHPPPLETRTEACAFLCSCECRWLAQARHCSSMTLPPLSYPGSNAPASQPVPPSAPLLLISFLSLAFFQLCLTHLSLLLLTPVYFCLAISSCMALSVLSFAALLLSLSLFARVPATLFLRALARSPLIVSDSCLRPHMPGPSLCHRVRSQRVFFHALFSP